MPATENRARRPGGDEDDFDDYDYGAHRHAYIDELPPALTHPHDVDRGENLRKIHAQSSAETSGLGDSLQRIHAHSSTETSGYADTIPSPTAAAYSPTGADTSSISGMAGRQQRVRRQLTDSVTETVRHTDTGPFPEPGPLQKKRSGRPAVASRARSIDSAAAGADGRERGNGGADGSAPSHAMSTRKKRLEKDSAGTARYEALQSPDDAAPQPMFETPPTSRKWTRPDFLAEFAPPLSRENSAGSSLAGSVGSAGSNLFLGRSTQSTWLQWSHARRASFKQKIVSIDERQKEEEKNRVTTPVLKARKESLMFVSTDTQRKGSPPPADTRLMVCSELPAEITSRTMARRKLATNDKDEVKLTVMQWRALVAFWEHPLFVRSRGGGIVLSLVAFACGVFSIVTHDWSLFDGKSFFGVVTHDWSLFDGKSLFGVVTHDWPLFDGKSFFGIVTHDWSLFDGKSFFGFVNDWSIFDGKSFFSIVTHDWSLFDGKSFFSVVSRA